MLLLYSLMSVLNRNNNFKESSNYAWKKAGKIDSVTRFIKQTADRHPLHVKKSWERKNLTFRTELNFNSQ